MNPRIGQSSMGALIGAVVGAMGGLFAIGIAPAVMARDLAVLFATPMLGFICWGICGVTGWLLGGQFGPRLDRRLGDRRWEVAGGAVGGLIPVLLTALLGWYLVTPH